MAFCGVYHTFLVGLIFRVDRCLDSYLASARGGRMYFFIAGCAFDQTSRAMGSGAGRFARRGLC